ncbi:MAG: DUF1189 family protein [Acholeplasmataceae bacterium]|nr:DUF1189 family protein [Acholeplasmataceae bacterium]
MFKKFTTSLSKPPLTIFFMRDSWFKIILYVIFVTFLMTTPTLIKTIINPTMDLNRYQEMQSTIKTDFIVQNAQITDGTLTFEAFDSFTFDYFNVYLGNHDLDSNSINFVFEESDLAIYVVDIEIDRQSYASLNLENYDFSSTDDNDIVKLSVAIKKMYEAQSFIWSTEVLATYFLSLFDYILISLLMATLMFFFVNRIPVPFGLRLKLSFYLTTVYGVIQLILVLFNATYLSFLALFVVYIYNIWTYKSIKIMPKGVI